MGLVLGDKPSLRPRNGPQQADVRRDRHPPVLQSVAAAAGWCAARGLLMAASRPIAAVAGAGCVLPGFSCCCKVWCFHVGLLSAATSALCAWVMCLLPASRAVHLLHWSLSCNCASTVTPHLCCWVGLDNARSTSSRWLHCTVLQGCLVTLQASTSFSLLLLGSGSQCKSGLKLLP